jgi:hypothetical protein
LVSTNVYAPAVAAGIAVDYDAGTTNGRISVGGSANLTFYGGGVGTTALLRLYSSGAIGVGSTPSAGTSGQILTSAGSGAAPTWSTPSGTSKAQAIAFSMILGL